MIRILGHRPTDLDSEDHTRLQLYTVCVVVGIPVLVGYGVSDLFGGQYVLSGLVFVASALLLLGRLVLARLPTAATNIYRANALVFATLLTYMLSFSGDDGSRILWMYVFPLTSLFLFGRREGLIWTAAPFAWTVIVFWQAPAWCDIYPYSTGFKLRFITTYVVVSSFAYWYEHFRSTYRIDAEAKHTRLQQEQHRLVHEITQRRRLEVELKQLANTDFLTGTLNRRRLWEVGDMERERHQRYSYSLSLALIDIDHFKQINDRFGHPAGDEVIRSMVSQCKSVLRQSDVLGRIGGEEFMVLLVHTDMKHAIEMADRVRRHLSTVTVHTDRGEVGFTVSIGLTEISADDRSIDDAVKRADGALYLAKKNGRNRIEAAPPPSMPTEIA